MVFEKTLNLKSTLKSIRKLSWKLDEIGCVLVFKMEDPNSFKIVKLKTSSQKKIKKPKPKVSLFGKIFKTWNQMVFDTKKNP
jgi:hypothetical protein